MVLNLKENGFDIIEDVYSEEEINAILEIIEANNLDEKFGVREFLKDNTEVIERIFSEKLLSIIKEISPACDKSIKSIYFDKPPSSNWIVTWHQDLTINLENREEIPNFKNWRKTNERVVVQPNIEFLESIFTIRIHLDKCTKENGALRVIEKSHKDGVVDIQKWKESQKGNEKICEVEKGGVLIMKPLILHSSRRTENQKRRRVIHIEFTEKSLPKKLKWKEKIKIEKEKYG